MSQAVVFERFGGPEVLDVVDVPVPEPGPGRVTVEVRAAGINPGEAAIREGALEHGYTIDLPSGQGSDFAGVVTQTGEGVTTVVPGDDVLGWSDERSAHAAHVEVPADHLVRKPTEVSWEAAGALKVAGATAFAVTEAAGAGEGERVAVSAAAGGVGSIAVQLMRLRGAEVIGIASERNHEWLRSVDVTPVAYGPGIADRIRAHAPDGPDAFVDLFGPEYLDLAVELGVPRERIVTVISFDRAQELGVRVTGEAEASDPAVLNELVNLVAGRLITVPIAATYPLQEVREAFSEVEQRHTHGKIVLKP